MSAICKKVLKYVNDTPWLMVRKYLPKNKSLAGLFPNLVAEWHPDNGKSPEDFLSKSNKKVRWICQVCTHEWNTAIAMRTGQNTGCPVCAGKAVHIDGRNSLAVLCPKLVEEWHPNNEKKPEDFVLNSNKKIKWICKICTHEWGTAIAMRTRQNTGCPACSGNVIHKDGRNSLAALHPELVSEWHPCNEKTPEEYRPGSSKKVKWICSKCDDHWETTISRRSKGRGCHACVGRKVHRDGSNSLEKINPSVAAELHFSNGISAIDIVNGSHNKLRWECVTCQHQGLAKVDDRNKGRGCPACANKSVHIDGRNSLATLNPKLINEWHPDNNLSPADVISTSHLRVKWLCEECNHDWKIPIRARTTRNKTGCPCCSGRVPKRDGSNSLKVLNPELAKEWHSDNEKPPQEYLPFSSKKVLWKCSICGLDWKTSINDRSRNIDPTGCPSCAKYGIDPTSPTEYYSMRIEGPEGIWWWKGGISIDPERRAKQIEKSIRREGMLLDVILHDSINFKTGKKAMEFERKLLNEMDIRVDSQERFQGSKELFNCNPIEWAKMHDFLII